MPYPQLGPTYYTDNDKALRDMMEYYYANSITLNQAFWSEADIDTRFEAGDQTLWNDLYGNLPAFRQKQFNFNHIRSTKNLIGGYQRRNRKSTIVVPQEASDEETASQLSKTLFWVNQNAGVLDSISQAFDGALVTGLNLLAPYMDYSNDPISGDVALDVVHYNGFLIDPYFQKQDLSDCNFIWRRSWLSQRQIMALLPDKSDEILSLNPMPYTDGKFQFMPESYNYGMKDLMTYDEFWYRDYREQTLIVDTQSGESMEWRGKEEELEEFLSQYPQVTSYKQQVPTVRLGISVQDKTMYHGPNPMGIDCYPFVPVMGYYNPQLPYYPYRIQGIVRGLRDSQYLYNRRRVIELDMLESQVTTGWIFKENALVNPKDVYLYGQGRGIALKEDAQMTDLQQIPPPQIPQSMMELSKALSEEIPRISGVNEELLGSAQDDKAGVLSMLRQGAGLTTLQQLFDQLDTSQKLLGDICIKLIQNNFTPGKIRRIINEEPTLSFYSKAFGKYDAEVEEGLNTPTQRQMQFAQLMELKQMGLPIPTKTLLDASTMQNKQELIKDISQEEQQQAQQQQQMQQLQQQQLQSQIDLSNARAVADTGLGYERASRILENQALAKERIAETQKDDANAALDMVRAIKELKDMDLNEIIKKLQIVEQIRTNTEISGEETTSAMMTPEQLSGMQQQEPVQGVQDVQEGLEFLET